MAKTIKPYANDSESLEFGGLTVENHPDSVAVYGNLELTKDKEGLANAKTLKAVVDAVVAALEKEKDLPAKVAAPEAPQEVKNPFA